MRKAGRKTLGVVCPIFVATIFAALAFLLCSCAAATQSLPEITDIYSPETVVEYDGHSHGIEIRNVLDTDVVYYSTDGDKWQTDKIEYTETGDYTVRYKIVRSGFADFIDFGQLRIVRTVLADISADDVTVVYDGAPHGIHIDGLLPGDVVTYSNGNAFTDVGEYEVKFTVERGGGRYSGECTVTVLPDILGDYVNPYGGVIRITETAVFDIAGSGVIYGKPFRVSDDILYCDDLQYIKRAPHESLFVFDVNGTAFYHIGGGSVEFYVRFLPVALVVDDVCYAVSGEYNYEESVTTDAALFADGARYTVVADGDRADIRITLSERVQRDLPDTAETIIYDGVAHEISARYDGKVVYSLGGVASSDIPTVTDIGEYVYEITVLDAVYLPATTVHKVTVVLDGAYYSPTTAAEFNGLKAAINDVEYTVDYAEKQIGGKTLATEDGCVVYGDERLTAAGDGMLMCVSVNGAVGVVLLPRTQIDETYAYITCDGREACVRLENWSGTVYSYAFPLTDMASVSIEVNGVAPLFDEANGRYVFTPTELSRHIARVVVEIR